MKYKFAELVNITKIQKLMEGLYLASGIPSAIIEPDGNILVAVGWRDICVKFHRVNNETEILCRQSDRFFERYIKESFGDIEPFICYKCPNGFIDAATPIIIEGEHVANIFQGQFLFEKPDIEYFRKQARRYGFDEKEYLEALADVPIYSEEKLNFTMNFFKEFGEMLTQMGLAKLHLIETQKKALQASEALVEELHIMDENKNQFLSMLSHELRNPLASIMISLSFLDRVIAGGEVRKAIEIMRRQTGQLSRLVDDLLDVTRINQKKIGLKKESVNLNEIITRVVEDYKGQFESKGVKLDVELSPVTLHLEADQARLTQVIGNLLHNAAKFTAQDDKTLVTVSRDSSNHEAMITVQDTGRGIPAAILPNLFEPFIQVDNSLDRSNGGLGLGLAIVKGMVELHGGTVTVYSEGLGKGTKFTIRLPAAATQKQEKKEKLGRVSSCIRKILIIDDIQDIAEIICSLLRHLGHKVITASSGPEGIAKAKEFQPEVVLCDIGLPGMNGYEVARRLRSDKEFKDTFLIALSGYAQSEDLERSREAGFMKHLAKPVNLDTLEQTLAEVPFNK